MSTSKITINSDGQKWFNSLKSGDLIDDRGCNQIVDAAQKSSFFAGEINAAGEIALKVVRSTGTGLYYDSTDLNIHIGSDMAGWENQNLLLSALAHEMAHALQQGAGAQNGTVPDGRVSCNRKI